MSRRNRAGNDDAGNANKKGGIGSTIKRILKIKLIILLILIVLSVFGVLYIVDWVGNLFGGSNNDTAQYVQPAAIVMQVSDLK